MDEFDESNECIFVMQGQVVIGYEINKIKKYCLKFNANAVIGDYGMTFNERSQFIYTALTDLKTLYIRKSNWVNILSEFPDIGRKMISKIFLKYMNEIKNKVTVSKKRAIAEFIKRNDHSII